VNSDLRRLLRDLRRSGWRIEQRRHLRIYPPGSGRPVTSSCTPSDHRAYQNLLTQLRHAWHEQGPRP